MKPLDYVIWLVVVVLLYVFVTVNTRASGEVDDFYQLPIGSFEKGGALVYRLGAGCYVLAFDGPMGKRMYTMACRQVACE